MYFEYDTPVWSFVIIWSTPSSKNAQVVGKSELAGGIGVSPAEVKDEAAGVDMVNSVYRSLRNTTRL